MKRFYQYTITGLLSMAFLATSCEKEEPDFYDKNENGVYFDYAGQEEFQTSVNFADHVLGNPQELKVELDVKLLGYLMENDRKAVLKTKPVEGYPEATVTIPDVVFTAEESEKKVEITVARPQERDTEYAVCLYFDADDAQSQLGHGIKGKEEFVIYVEETYTPAWTDYDWFVMYIGTWTVDKHIFFINLTQDNNYASVSKLNDYYTVLNYNLIAVNALRQQHAENPDEPITINIPFSSDNSYAKPPYWGESHDKYLGNYSSGLFASLASAAGANTTNEFELLGDENAVLDLHKTAVKAMMNQYNIYIYQWGLTGNMYKSYSWTPMYAEMEYDVVKPYHWENTWAYGAGDMISQYYGEYSEEKYKFMIKTWLEKQGTENFVLIQMFPVCLSDDWWSAAWDSTIGGEDQIKECYKAFKAAYDAAPAGTYNFTFPELNIE